ncbi:hypothetical protein UAW_01904 [Enterococcus haemoperoxidus ATCC BAA-382]|uniref:Uncharacterized protein n=1 Tax=Enterococcus haemoperoxidus ATCC BAA-382 TaxID=1158608 RepID=R2QHK1_9ENTE|nr:hypothetical protein [Enterococcus haemoperoxidus]EOH96047.1 hypothetical protein UAW_01904 [Enterococcus haemoperoxidus ATCC BAA-382]EOT60235.1 hypothetical protein I583_02870 [Enterococcus haemoperoxidus ATCC BAA-382]OJG53356.1 hypothetical protein RV06_GL000760 [Enterococcus haemoperoxidus]
MKIQFLGIKNQVKKSGCSSCGSRQVSKHTFQREARMVLPSGQVKTFYVGEVYNVMEQDGEFLLKQMYSLDGQNVKMFKAG